MSLETKPLETETPEKESPAPAKKGGQVLGYIMILFIAAFLLMTLSFLMHQRSNTEAIGKLEHSFSSTIDDLQSLQERIYFLEDEVSSKTAALKEAETALEEKSAALESSLVQQAAMTNLYCLQQKYSNAQYAACMALIESMEASGLADALPSTPLDTEQGSVTAPYIRFHQFKAAVQAKLASAD